MNGHKKSHPLGEGFRSLLFYIREELKYFLRLGCFSSGSQPTGGKGGADDGKEGIFRFIILMSVQKFGKGVFKIVGIHVLPPLSFKTNLHD